MAKMLAGKKMKSYLITFVQSSLTRRNEFDQEVMKNRMKRAIEA